MKLSLPILFLALVATVASAALCARPGFPGGPGPGPAGDMFFLDLAAVEIGIAEDQQATIDELIDSFKLASAVDRERMSQLRKELRDLGDSTAGFDAGAADTLASELGGLVASTAVAGAELRYEIMQVLTEEQRDRLHAFMGEMRRHRFSF